MSSLPFHDEPAALKQRGRVIVIDDDPEILDAFHRLLSYEGYACEIYLCAESFLQAIDSIPSSRVSSTCVVCDVNMPQMTGLEVQARLQQLPELGFVLMSGSSGALEAVTAFRAGAVDFLLKPIDADLLLTTVERALARSLERQETARRHAEATRLLDTLSAREAEVARLVAAGLTGLGISLQLEISLSTVKFHRQRLMEKLGISGTPELVRLLHAAERK